MHPDDLLAVMRRTPFTPFRLHVSEGSFYDIKHPERLLLTRRAAHIGVPSDDPIPEGAAIVSLVHICRLEHLPAAPAKGGNGQQGGLGG